MDAINIKSTCSKCRDYTDIVYKDKLGFYFCKKCKPPEKKKRRKT